MRARRIGVADNLACADFAMFGRGRNLDNRFDRLLDHGLGERLARHFFAARQSNLIGDIALAAFARLYDAIFARLYGIIHFGHNGELLFHKFGNLFGLLDAGAFLSRRIHKLKAGIAAAGGKHGTAERQGEE